MCFLLKFSTFAYYSVLIRQRFFQIGLETLPVQWINILAVRLSAIVSLYVQSSHFILAFYFIVNYCICCWSFHLTNIQGGPKKVKPQTWLSRALYSSSSGMTKYRKGPQRTTKDRKGPTKDPQRTANGHYGLSCRKLAPIELNGALYSSARQDFSHAAGLSWQPSCALW